MTLICHLTKHKRYSVISSSVRSRHARGSLTFKTTWSISLGTCHTLDLDDVQVIITRLPPQRGRLNQDPLWISLFCSQKNFNLDPCYRQAFVGSQTWRQFAGRKLLTRTGPSIHYKQAVVGSETWRQFARSKSAALTNPQVLLSTLRKVGERMSQMTFMLSLRL